MRRMMLVLALGLIGCGGDEETALGEREVAGNKPVICPMIKILCEPGYHSMDVGKCRQVCVPDSPSYDWQCSNTVDCPTIYCFAAPCPQQVCTGHKCVIPPTGSNAGESFGRPCGPVTCLPGDVCCNRSCGICTPPDGFCTQQVCKPVK